MRLIPLILLVGLVSACGDTNIYNPVAPPPAAPVVPIVTTTKVEFRVVGNASSARIRYSDPLDGLTQTVTTLPYFVSFTTDQKLMFLSLDVTPLGYSMGTTAPFLAAQIVINGTLFREATSSDFLMGTISVNGTWRQ
jgi:hypothetical protein